MRPTRRILAAALVVLAALWSAPWALAQDDPAERTAAFYSQLDTTLAAARLVIAAPESDPSELENMREKLLVLRGQAVTAEKAAADALAEATARMEPLGPAPTDGATEPPELRERRAALTEAVAEAQVPLLRAQDAARRINDMIAELDREVWTRVSTELRTLGPSPVLPESWLLTSRTLGERLADARATVSTTLEDPTVQRNISRKLPRNLALFALGLAVTFGLRLRLNAWVERALGRASSPRAIAWLVALRNFSRLLVPAVGAGLLFAALDPALLEGTERIKLFNLPPFVLAIIGADWLANSLFSPRLAQYRLIPVDDAEAATGVWLARLLGGVLAAHLFVVNHLGYWEMTPAVNATLAFPLALLGGYGLWRVAALQRSVQRNIAELEANLPPEQHMSGLGLGLLAFLERAVWVAAIGAPVLAAIGFFAAAQALLYPMILSLGLFGANLVLFDLIRKTGLTLRAARQGTASPDGGLAPVVVVILLTLLSAPLLALIWGARPSELVSFWLLLREGGSLGGIRISAGVIVSFVVVFAICFAITRAVQSVLVSSVLPRTKMDAGGKNAVLAGVTYLGFAIAVLVSISATGIDLSSIAIVAGALSVGIGFGLQNIVSNFVSGIILLIERPIKEGDWIEVGTYVGYVRRISVRSTEIETFDRATVILPNSDLVSGTVLNRTHTGMSGRIQVPVSVTYDSDARKVAALLLDIAEDHPLVLEDPAPRVLLMDLGPDSINFEIRCWLRDVNFALSARSDINFDVVERLNAAGIRMVFWQRDVRPPPPEEIGAAPAAEAGPPARVVKQS